MRFHISAVMALSLVAGCGGGDDSPTPTSPAPIPAAETCGFLGGTAILNGATCAPDAVERSAVVLLNMDGDGLSHGACSGTVVTKRAILTAAHCLDEGVERVRVWFGPPNPQIVAESFVFFPGYAFNSSGFDVGVVFMGEDIPRNPVPILLSRDVTVGETAIIAGWGRDQDNVTATLHSGSTRITAVGNGLLQTPFAPPSASICQGDSGGPILVSEGGAWSVAGISSATSGNICNQGTNFYQAVRHPSVRDFILQHVPGAPQR